MHPVTLVVDPTVLTLETILPDQAGMTLVVRTSRPQAACPDCLQLATRVHSWYTRQLADLPWQGLAVHLQLRTRRWFCDNPLCGRRIFTERFPTVTAPHSRHTTRLATIMLVFGVAVGGAPGARLLQELGIVLSGVTLLRAVCRAAVPDLAPPRVLGVDDWSRRKGRTYGTILVDLERHRPVDLLPDRAGERLAQWLTEHPGIEIICRDRGGAYADGARQGAPDAVQVADRWHLLANLGAMLERVLVRHHALLRQVRLSDDLPPTISDPTTAPAIASPRPLTRTEQERQRRDRRREARYQEIHALHHEGYSVRAIARQLGLHRQTVRKYLAASTCPHPGPRPNRGRMITPYLPYLRQQWETGERRVMVLWTAILAQGFPGSWRRVQEQLVDWRRAERRAGNRAAASTPRPIPSPGKRCAPRQVAGWLVRAPNELTPTQQTYLEALIVAGPELGAVRSLAQDFTRIVRTRDEAGLDPWLVGAEGSETAEVREFAAGIRRDYAAVSAALAYAWSSGQVEGQINRLKLVKRSMYGRSGFNLLRQRFLLAA